MLKGKNMASEDYSCIFNTSTEDKATEHFFLHCTFASNVGGRFLCRYILTSPVQILEILK